MGLAERTRTECRARELSAKTRVSCVCWSARNAVHHSVMNNSGPGSLLVLQASGEVAIPVLIVFDFLSVLSPILS